MKILVATPILEDDNKISVELNCPELHAKGELKIDFSNLLPFANYQEAATDLFMIGCFVYGVDRFIERHTNSLDGWTRELSVKLPVYDLKKWQSQVDELNALLSFLTGDHWTIEFYKNTLSLPKIQIPDNFKANFSQVNLFSGGLDSLIGTIDFLSANVSKKLLVVSHFDPNISAQPEQVLLRNALTEKYNERFNFVPSISVSLTHSNVEKEKTFRSRSLLFIGIAVLVANFKGLPIIVPENGTVSLNFPLSSSRRSALSTRTTHPTFIEDIRNLLKGLGINLSIENTYDLMTKGEMVSACMDLAFLKSVVSISKSCGKSGHVVNWTEKDKSHCGVCMPCIYRQAALQNITDTTGYGNLITKKLTGRNNHTPFLLSKELSINKLYIC